MQSTISDTLLHAGRDNRVTNAHYGDNIFSKPDPLARLHQYTALGALHDAAERPDPPRCHEDTRIAILDRINRWARKESGETQPILWLNGAAGAGKSAICQTMIERWREGDLIVPNFFFWRTAAKRNQKTYLIPTIAFQLTELLPETKPIVEEAARDGTIFQRNLKAQVERLIINPVQRCRTHVHPVIIVIDGLDECREDLPKSNGFSAQTHEDQQREILEAIAFASQKMPSLRFLIATRPETQIRTSFRGKTLAALSLTLSLNDEGDTASDIALYLDCQFAEIRSRYPGIPPTWPSKEQVNELVQKSSGQFIYPSTVIKYVSQARRHPVTQLNEVLALHPVSGYQEDHPLSELDSLYTFVLGTVHKDSLPIVMVLLGHMSVHGSEEVSSHAHPLSIFRNIREGYNTVCLEKYLFLEEGELSVHLTDLHSILALRPNTGDGILDIGFFHATFPEYLQDPTRSGNYSVSEAGVNLQIAHILLRHGNTLSPPPPECSVYDLSELYAALVYFSSISPPSYDLMKALWSHLKDEIGEYDMISEPERDPGIPQYTHNEGQSKYLRGPISPYIQNFDKGFDCVALLGYLQMCNIPEFEPSKQRRRAIGAHLVYLLKLTDPDEMYAGLTYHLLREGSEEEEHTPGASGLIKAHATEGTEEGPSPSRVIGNYAPASPLLSRSQTNTPENRRKSRLGQFWSDIRTQVSTPGKKRT